MTTKEQGSTELRQLVRKLAATINADMLRLGNVLLAIHSNRYWEKWGYDDWGDYVGTEAGMGPASSYRLLAISRWMLSERPTKAQRETIVSIGRTKAYYLTLTARKRTLDEWLAKAQKMTAAQLRSAVNSITGRWESTFVGFHVSRAQLRSINRAIGFARDYYDDPDAPIRGEALATACDQFVKNERKGATRTRKSG